MESYISRMVDEEVDLYNKISKLGLFMTTNKFHNLSDEEKNAMFKQQEYMEKYRDVLKKRIETAIKKGQSTEQLLEG